MATDKQEWTVGDLLAWTADYLKQRGSASPRLDAEVLLAHARDCQRIHLYTDFADVPRDDQRRAFRELVRRRADGEPVAYLVGHKEFYSLEFLVTPDVLIPRPETELLVMTALDEAKGVKGEVAIADVGAGSGAIAVTLAKHLPRARVTAVDISPPALNIARHNAQRHDVADRIDFLESDLLEAVHAEAAFQFIVSNPPYVSRAEMGELPSGIAEHEPSLALAGGETGLEVTERLVAQAASRLIPGGCLLIETSPHLAQRLQTLLGAHDAYQDANTLKDLAGLARVVRAIRA